MAFFLDLELDMVHKAMRQDLEFRRLTASSEWAEAFERWCAELAEEIGRVRGIVDTDLANSTDLVAERRRSEEVLERIRVNWRELRASRQR